MQNWWKKVICAGLVGISFFASQYAEAGVPNKFPMLCYASKQVYTYNAINGSRVGYISANVDLIQIKQRSGDWVYGTYPTSRGTVARWFRLSDIVPNLNFANYDTHPNANTTAYRTENGNEKLGSVYTSDNITVVYRGVSRSQVIYPISGGYKMGWVANSSLTSAGQTLAKPSNLNISTDKGVYTVGETINFVFSATNANNLYIPIDVDGKRAYWNDVTGRSSFAFKTTRTGTYGFFLHGRNSVGETSGTYKEIRVVAASTIAPVSRSVKKGDLNGDGKIDNNDLPIIIDLYFGVKQPTASQKITGDVNNDGKINLSDVTLLRLKLNNKKGDMNIDGNVDSKDLDVLMAYLQGKSKDINVLLADVNEDGTVNITDATELRKLIPGQMSSYNVSTNVTVPTQQENSNVKKTAMRTVNAYTNSSLTRRTGNERVDKGDVVTVLGEGSNYYYVRYPVSNGTKDRYVGKDIFKEVPQGNDSVVYNRMLTLSTSSSGYIKNTKYTGSGQCRGFANKVYTTLFNVNSITGYTSDNYGATSYSGSYIVGTLRNYAENDVSSVKRLIYKAKPGAFIQLGRRNRLNSTGTAPNPHSAILMDFNENSIVLYEANADGKNTIQVNTYSWSRFTDRNKGMTIYLPNNYSLR